MWYKIVGTSFCRYVTIYALDGQTDSFFMVNSALHYRQSHGKNGAISGNLIN